MNTRRIIFLAALILAAVLFVFVLPALAQDGGDCTTCPVSFNNPSTLDPNSPGAAETLKLFYVILWIAAFVFVVVEGMLLFTIFRFRNRPAAQAVQTHGNTKLEIAWTAVPALILMVLLGFTLRSMAVIRAPAESESLAVKVIGHQWWWEFQYPQLGITTANQLVVPVGTTIDVELQSVDVEHGFWSPQLFGKMDAIPGHTNRMRFTVSGVGEYGAQCTQFCGEQHAQMRFSVVGVTAADFQKWAAAQQEDAAQPTDEAAVRGKKAFADNGCVACHSIAGYPAAVGRVGPNLTHLASRDFIAGGILTRTADNLKLWVKNAPAIKPGTTMPNFSEKLDDQTLSDIAAYLSTLK